MRLVFSFIYFIFNPRFIRKPLLLSYQVDNGLCEDAAYWGFTIYDYRDIDCRSPTSFWWSIFYRDRNTVILYLSSSGSFRLLVKDSNCFQNKLCTYLSTSLLTELSVSQYQHFFYITDITQKFNQYLSIVMGLVLFIDVRIRNELINTFYCICFYFILYDSLYLKCTH